MPYAFETKKKLIPKEPGKDNRRKLTDWEKDLIRELYGQVSQRKLARLFGVSRRLIIFIGDPEKHKANMQRRADTGGSKQYYSREKQRTYMRTHRRHKRKLDLTGDLIERTVNDDI